MKASVVYKFAAWVAIAFLFFVIVSGLAWYFQSKKPYSIYILDKTVPDNKRTEHKSFNWILNNYRITNKNLKAYNYNRDYYGYFPYTKVSGSRDYLVKSLRLSEILTIPDELDMVYYADAYGVNKGDIYDQPSDRRRRSTINYGGLNQNDYLLLSEMKRKNKLIIAEFNMLESPTADLIRQKTENLFDIEWTGWKGCYFKSLDTTNVDLPANLIQAFEKEYHQKWNYKGAGIVLFQEKGNIIVLNDSLLSEPYIKIITGQHGQDVYHLPKIQNYSYWFEIIKSGNNNVISNYHLPVNDKGKRVLEKYGLSTNFPAVIEHLDGYKFYYFAGDFSDRNISMVSSYSKGFASVASVFYSSSSSSKKAFFWRYYKPLIYNIINKNLINSK